MKKSKIKMKTKLKKVNREIRTARKLKSTLFIIENTIWNESITETLKIEIIINNLISRRTNLKRAIFIEAKKAEDPNYIPEYKDNGPSIDEIKTIPIKQILESLGVEILRNNFFKIRNEKTSSAQFNEDKNLFYDHGDSDMAGSNIDLIMNLKNYSVADSIKYLKENFSC